MHRLWVDMESIFSVRRVWRTIGRWGQHSSNNARRSKSTWEGGAGACMEIPLQTTACLAWVAMGMVRNACEPAISAVLRKAARREEGACILYCSRTSLWVWVCQSQAQNGEKSRRNEWQNVQQFRRPWDPSCNKDEGGGHAFSVMPRTIYVAAAQVLRLSFRNQFGRMSRGGWRAGRWAAGGSRKGHRGRSECELEGSPSLEGVEEYFGQRWGISAESLKEGKDEGYASGNRALREAFGRVPCAGFGREGVLTAAALSYQANEGAWKASSVSAQHEESTAYPSEGVVAESSTARAQASHFKTLRAPNADSLSRETSQVQQSVGSGSREMSHGHIGSGGVPMHLRRWSPREGCGTEGGFKLVSYNILAGVLE